MSNEDEINTIINLSGGDLGAINVMSQLFRINFNYINILQQNEIKSYKIWVLYKDICCKDINQVIKILNKLEKDETYKYIINNKNIVLLEYIKNL